MKQYAVLAAMAAFGLLIIWQMIFRDRGGGAEEAAEAAQPPVMAPVQQNPRQREQRFYEAVRARLATDRVYRWSEITSLVDICGITPCLNDVPSEAGNAFLRVALVRNGWFEIDARDFDPEWTHDGFTP